MAMEDLEKTIGLDPPQGPESNLRAKERMRQSIYQTLFICKGIFIQIKCNTNVLHNG